jgi:hypothetical protein
MKTTKWVFFGALVLTSYAALAQDYAFQVMINKGANEVKSGATWQPVKTGATLKPGDEIKLGNNAYLGLRHSSGKMTEVRQAGTHKVADLAAKVTGGASVLNKYTDFILSSNSAEAKKNRLSATGAVHRGAGDAAIDLLLPEYQFSRIFESKVILNWESKNEGPYIVELQNMFEDVLATYETAENNYLIDLTDAKLKDNESSAIMVRISLKNDPKQMSALKMIQRLSPEEDKKIKLAISEMGESVQEESAINKFFMANFYEQNNLVVDAITAYQEAIKLEPAFKEDYEDFLQRKGLKAPKQ